LVEIFSFDYFENICVVKIAAFATQNCSSKELALQCRE
jgi:hypothetical protein